RFIADCESSLERWQSEYEEAQTCWIALWEPTAIVPDVPEVMSAWISHLERLRERADSWRASVQRSDRLARRRDELFEMLIAALPELESARSLEDALDTARERQRAIDEVLSERKRHERDLDRLRGELANARSDRIAIENQLHIEH